MSWLKSLFGCLVLRQLWHTGTWSELQMNYMSIWILATETRTGNKRTEWNISRLWFCVWWKPSCRCFALLKVVLQTVPWWSRERFFNSLKGSEDHWKGPHFHRWRGRQQVKTCWKRNGYIEFNCAYLPHSLSIISAILISDCIQPFVKLWHPVALGSLSGSRLAEEGERGLHHVSFQAPSALWRSSEQAIPNSLFRPQLVSLLIA